MPNRPAERLVEIEWIDSVTDSSGWTYTEDAKSKHSNEVMQCHSVGYLFANEEDYIVLVKGFQGAETKHAVESVSQIPKVAITKMTFLERTARRR